MSGAIGPITFEECVERSRSNLMRAESLLAQGGGALADVHANVAAGWGTLAMVLGPLPPDAGGADVDRPPISHFGAPDPYHLTSDPTALAEGDRG